MWSSEQPTRWKTSRFSARFCCCSLPSCCRIINPTVEHLISVAFNWSTAIISVWCFNCSVSVEAPFCRTHTGGVAGEELHFYTSDLEHSNMLDFQYQEKWLFLIIPSWIQAGFSSVFWFASGGTSVWCRLVASHTNLRWMLVNAECLCVCLCVCRLTCRDRANTIVKLGHQLDTEKERLRTFLHTHYEISLEAINSHYFTDYINFFCFIYLFFAGERESERVADWISELE